MGGVSDFPDMILSPKIRQIIGIMAVLCACASNSALGSATTISSSNIVLPDVDEFEMISRDSPDIHPILAQMAQDCDGERCGIYAGESNGADRPANTWQALTPFILLDVLDDELVVQAGQFPALMQMLGADAEGFRANTEADFAELPFDIDIAAPDGSELVFVDALADASDEFYESGICLAIPASGIINYKHQDGSIISYGLHLMVGFVHVKDKILVTSLIAPGKDLEWTKRTFEEFINVLAEENR